MGKTTHELRHTMCLTQKQFAERYGIPYRTVCGWDSRGTMPDYLYSIFVKYIIPLDELVYAVDHYETVDYEALN